MFSHDNDVLGWKSLHPLSPSQSGAQVLLFALLLLGGGLTQMTQEYVLLDQIAVALGLFDVLGGGVAL